MPENLRNTDRLQREYRLPVRLVLTEGAVEGAELLLRTAAEQVGLGEHSYAHLRGKCRIVLDFGQEMRGGLRVVAARGTEGVPMRLRLGESVNECLSEIGRKGSTNNHALRDITVPLPMLSDQSFFDSGFRFACIDFPAEETDVLLRAVNAVSVGSGRAQIGSFVCSDPLVNQIYDVAARTVQLCSAETIWDGIKRDRLVWVGDLYPEIASLLTLCADDGCVTRSLDFVKDETPLPRWMNDFPMYSMWWIIILDEYYRLTGNAQYILEQKEYYEKLIRQIDGCIAENGDFDFGMNFVDWPTHEQPDEPEGVRSLCKLCARSGRNLEALYGTAGGVAARIEEKLSRKGAEVIEKKQIAALKYLSGTPLSGRERAILTEGGARGFSTFMSYFLLTALSEVGGDEAALSAMKEYYGGMLAMGATSFWEDFDVEWMQGAVCPIDRAARPGEKDIHGDFGRYCYVGYRHSLCHGWSAGVIPFLVKHVLGVRVEEAGYRKVRIEPRLGGLEYVDAAIPTPHGVLRVHCRKEGGRTVVRAEAPAGVEVIAAE